MADEIYVRDPDIPEKEVFHDLVDKKLEAFIQSNIQRCVRLANSISILLEGGEELSAMIIARSLLETIAFLWDFKCKLRKFKDNELKKPSSNQEQAITNFVADWSFSTQQEDLLKVESAPEKKSPSILGQVRDFGKEMKDNSFKLYDFLSEVVRPNNYGCVDRFSTFNDKKRVLMLGKDVSKNEGLPLILDVLLKLRYVLELQKELQKEIPWIKALIKPIWIADPVKK